ncbi:SigE family RNA polymerase sigma factor [Streptomyces albipurpureus]|uniref:RNA polymerase sigma factor n=1 Tax=Streptomyces albipurpureus TaxID=2897419 RepID=A0ABT0V0V2_9ACTN|nr:SigE family RNA polymerase sigma factor [Streptomyces sp. CWNU-1]MCM2393804.1 SigE family RNA polymerase sigma factor [Streptomyces sp. CWNU-1]
MAHGEVLGFEEYVRSRQEALLRSARRLVPDPIDAQDLLQTALARTYGRWDGIADKSLADAYLRRVMINTRTEWWRARKLEEVPTEQLPDARVDDGSDQRADRAQLMDALKVLAPKQRSVVVLRHWEQMSTEETAAALGMSAGTVKSTLHRALARLRQELERQETERQETEDRETVNREPNRRLDHQPQGHELRVPAQDRGGFRQVRCGGGSDRYDEREQERCAA